MAVTISDNLVVEGRDWLRIETDSRDDEIRQVFEACLIDLKNAGVYVTEIDSIIKQALKLYLKSYFGYDDNAAKFAESYEHLKRSLALSSDYNRGES